MDGIQWVGYSDGELKHVPCAVGPSQRVLSVEFPEPENRERDTIRVITYKIVSNRVGYSIIFRAGHLFKRIER